MRQFIDARNASVYYCDMTESLEHGVLHGKVAIVTGAGRGLGRAYAIAMASAGASVVVNDVDNDVARDVVSTIVSSGGSAVTEIGAVGSAEVADALVDRAVREYGRLDVMCTNAGVLRDRTLAKVTDEDFDLVLRTHLRGTVTCARSAVRQFKSQGDGGRLILVGSPAGQRASFGQTAYSAAKAAIVGLVRTWAVELERQRTTVNAVIPTALTRMAATIPGLSDAVDAAEAGEPVPPSLRRRGLGVPEDVAPLVVFLASDAAADVTGQAIAMGGDRLALWSHPREVVTLLQEGGFTDRSLAELFSTVLLPQLQPYGRPVPPATTTGAGR
jgi:NAD(P)-dependent dehydrogenase (short-subunit alcohol dehydrogenase family)